MKYKNKKKWLENKQKWFDSLPEKIKASLNRPGSIKTR